MSRVSTNRGNLRAELFRFISPREGTNTARSVTRSCWVLFGPDQLDKKARRLMRKMEQGGFAESPPMPEHAPPPSGRKNYGLGALAPLLLPLLALVGFATSSILSS